MVKDYLINKFIPYFRKAVLITIIFAVIFNLLFWNIALAKKIEISDKDVERIKTGLDIVQTFANIAISDDKIKTALDTVIGGGEAGTDVTYGLLVLSTMNEMELIDMVVSQRFKTEATDYFNRVIDERTNLINYWKGVGFDLPRVLSGGITGPMSALTLNSFSIENNVLQIFLSVRNIAIVQMYNGLWGYFDYRRSNYSHDEAWQNAKDLMRWFVESEDIDYLKSLPFGRLNPVVRIDNTVNQLESRFAELWDKWGPYTDRFGVTEAAKRQFRDEMGKIVLEAVEQQVLVEKKEEPSLLERLERIAGSLTAKLSEITGDIWNTIKSTISQFNPFGPAAIVQPSPPPPKAAAGEQPEEKPATETKSPAAETAEDRPLQTPDLAPEQESLAELQKMLDDAAEQIDVLAQKLAVLTAAQKQKTEKEKEEIDEEEVEELEEEEEKEFEGCQDGQINLNSASKEDLMEIIQIGSARADQIIELRKEKLFWSVNDLSRVSGIVLGGSRLEQIIQQGLACAAHPDDTSFEPFKKQVVPPGGRKSPPAPEEETLICKPGSINVNTASQEELEKLAGIEETLALRIIEEREKEPFYSLNELTRVYGIGEKTVENIKNQGCAYVDIEKPEEEEEEEKEEEEKEEEKEAEPLEITFNPDKIQTKLEFTLSWSIETKTTPSNLEGFVVQYELISPSEVEATVPQYQDEEDNWLDGWPVELSLQTTSLNVRGTDGYIYLFTITAIDEDKNKIASAQAQTEISLPKAFLQNPSFEEGEDSDARYWTQDPTAGATIRADEQARTGQWSMKQVQVTTSYGREFISYPLMIDPGETYTFGGWYYLADPGTGEGPERDWAFVEIRWLDENREFIDRDPGTGTRLAAFEQWTKFELTATAPTEVAYAQLRVRAKRDSGTPRTDVYWDDMFIEKVFFQTPILSTIADGFPSGLTIANNGRKIARASNGDLYVVYFRDSKIFLSVSGDNGVNWSEIPVTPEEEFEQKEPSIAIDSKDNLHIVWQGKDENGIYQIFYRKYNSSLEIIEDLSLTNNKSFHQEIPVIAIDFNNNPHIIWAKAEDVVINCPDIFRKIGLIYAVKNENNWQIQEVNLGGSEKIIYSFNLAIDNQNNLHLVRRTIKQSSSLIAYQKYSSSWQATQYLYAEAASFASLAIDINDTFHIVWNDRKGISYKIHPFFNESFVWGNNCETGTDNQVYCFYKESQILLKVPLNYSVQPVISLDSNGIAYLVWSQFLPSEQRNRIHFQRYPDPWETPQILETENSQFNQLYPNLLWSFTNQPETGFAFIFYEGTELKFTAVKI